MPFLTEMSLFGVYNFPQCSCSSTPHCPRCSPISNISVEGFNQDLFHFPVNDCSLKTDHFFAATDCILDDWADWGVCSKRCGWGNKERLRRVLVDKQNGGKKCGQTRQRVYCYGTKCKVERAQGGEAIRGGCY